MITRVSASKGEELDVGGVGRRAPRARRERARAQGPGEPAEGVEGQAEEAGVRTQMNNNE